MTQIGDPLQPKVSIVINNFNYSRFLGAAINSALCQTYKNCEILVVDDGSTDDSKTVIEAYGTRIRTLFKSNGGQASTYNAGFSATTGELVHFLDSDDVLAPGAIEEVVKVWEPGVSKVQFYLRVVEGIEGAPTKVLLPTCVLAEGNLAAHTLKHGHYNSPPASGNCYWRQSLEKIFPMPEEEWITCADTYPIFLSAFLGEVRAIHKPLGDYRVHGNNQAAQTSVTPQLLRYRLVKETRRDRMLASYAAKNNLGYHSGTVENHIGHMKIRLASLALDPGGHPLPQDTLPRISWKTIKLGLTEPEASIRKKMLIVGWVVTLLIAPASKKKQIIELGFIPTKRAKLFQRIMTPE